jgi:DNA-binding protein YbaB
MHWHKLYKFVCWSYCGFCLILNITIYKEEFKMELFKMAKEAMNMRSKMKDIDNRLRNQVMDVEYKGIKIKLNAKNEFLSLNIPECLLKEKTEKIEKLILLAFGEACKKAQSVMAEEAKKITGGMKMPGL